MFGWGKLHWLLIGFKFLCSSHHGVKLLTMSRKHRSNSSCQKSIVLYRVRHICIVIYQFILLIYRVKKAAFELIVSKIYRALSCPIIVSLRRFFSTFVTPSRSCQWPCQAQILYFCVLNHRDRASTIVHEIPWSVTYERFSTPCSSLFVGYSSDGPLVQ